MKRKNKKMLICQQKNSFYEKKARKNDDYPLNAGDSNDNDRCGFSGETTKKTRRKSHFPHLLSIISLLFLINIEHLLVGASEEPTTSTTGYNNNNNTSDFDESKIFGHFQGRKGSGSRTFFDN